MKENIYAPLDKWHRFDQELLIKIRREKAKRLVELENRIATFRVRKNYLTEVNNMGERDLKHRLSTSYYCPTKGIRSAHMVFVNNEWD